MIARHVEGWRVDVVVCSTATRAKATAKPVINSLGCPARCDDTMYAADTTDLLLITRGLPDHATSAMLVGHNPSLEEFTAVLCGSSTRYPTGALGTLELDIDHWSDTASECATLTTLVTPAELAE